MTNTLKATIGAAVVLVGMTLGAQAATVTYLDATGIIPAPTPVANATVGTVYEELSTSVAGQYTSPWAGTSHYGSATFSAAGIGGSLTYNVGLSNSIDFVWGTPDGYNTISFYLNGELVDSVSGSTITQRTSGFTNAAFVQIDTVSAFNSFVIASGSNSFEFALPTELTAVPVPAAGFLLVGALAGLGALSRRRKA